MIVEGERLSGPYVTDGVQSAFTFDFKVFASSDLSVLVDDDVLVLTTDYTVSLNGDQDSNPGGTVTLLTPASYDGPDLFISGDTMPYEQTNQFTNTGGFYPSVLNAALDRLTILIQQQVDRIGRALVAPVGQEPLAYFEETFKGTDGASFADQARTAGVVWGVTIPSDATDDEVLELLNDAFPPSTLAEIFQTTYGVGLLTDLAGISGYAEGETAIVAGDSGTDYLDPLSGTGPYANSGKYQVIGGDWTKVRTQNQARRDIDFGTWRGGYLDGQGVLTPARRPAVLEAVTLDGVDGSLYADYLGRLITTTNLNPGTLLDYTNVNGAVWKSEDFYRFSRTYGSDGGFFALKPGNGGQFGVYSGVDTVSGEVAAFVFVDWANQAHRGSADTASVIEVNWGNGTAGRVHNVTQGAYVISAKSYEYEVQPGSGGEVTARYYQSASADGATYRISNNGQTVGATAGRSLAIPMMGIVGGADTDYLLTLGRHIAGVNQTPKWYVVGTGRQVSPMIDLTEQAAPGDPAADTARLYSKDNGSGTTVLAFRDSAGVETVLAGLSAPSFTNGVTLAGAANATALTATGGGLTGANAQTTFNLNAGVVNTSGSATYFKFNYTATAEGASALIFDWQRSSTSLFSLTAGGMLKIGSGSPTSADPGVLLARSIVSTGSGNAHGFVEATNFRRAGSVGYAAFDAFTSMTGNTYDHWAGFQSRVQLNFSNGAQTINNVYGHYDILNVDTGTATNRFGVYIAAPTLTNGGAIGTQTAFFSETLSSATTNWLLYCGGATPSYTGGRFKAARLATDGYTVATLPASPAAGDRCYVTDASGPTFLATISGGGSTKCPVFYDGSAWKAC